MKMPEGKYKIAVIGIGKIALDQHLPVISGSDRFELAATVSTRGISHGGLPVYRTPTELYAAHPEIGIVASCVPPAVRHAQVREALDAGKHVLMEKPPSPSIAEFQDLVAHARTRDRVLFQTWHSQYNPAVDRARAILAGEGVKSVRIDWRESVRKWHPGQDWVWEPGGFGVCDPGINALSIFTRIMPVPVFVQSATLGFPQNRQTPVDVRIDFKSVGPVQPEMSAHFNWLEGDDEVWRITIETGAGNSLLLDRGGTVLSVNGTQDTGAPSQEYERIYARFADLLDRSESHADGAPLVLVADAFLLGRRETLPKFDW
jgi:D-galactose 1-dehydrogenase